jgi:hypothetical protein
VKKTDTTEQNDAYLQIGGEYMNSIDKIGSHAQIRTGDPYHVKVATKATQAFDLYEYLTVIATLLKACFTLYRSITYT